MDDFHDRVAVVTGASHGIGRAIAERFVREGMKVVIADIDAATLDRVAEELRSSGGDVLAVETDVARLESMENLARETVEAFGRVHVVCNNAGVTKHTGEATWELSDKDWQWLVGVNLWGVIHGIRVFVPLLLSHGEDGYVLNTASAAGLGVVGGAYGVTKHAVVSLSENLYLDLLHRGAKIGVSCLCPGLVATQICESERRRPVHLRDEGREELSLHRDSRARIAQLTEQYGGLPSAMADLVVDGMRAEQFYLCGVDPPMFHEIDERVRCRMQDILDRKSPRAILLRKEKPA